MREEQKKDEDWIRDVEFSEVPDEEGEEAEGHLKQAQHVLGVKRDTDRVTQEERTAQAEKIALEKKVYEKEDAERRQGERVKEIYDAGMSKEDLWREVKNQLKAQIRELKSQSIMEQTI